MKSFLYAFRNSVITVTGEFMFDLGIIGDGQLAKMLAEAKLAKGLSIAFLGKDFDGPCLGLGEHIVGDIYSSNDILTFAEQCKLCTFENEFIDFSALVNFEKSKFLPSANTLLTIGDKLSEKNLAQELGIAIGKFSLLEATEQITVPSVIKAIKGGYDGYGTFLIRNEKDKEFFLANMDAQKKYIIEDFVPLKRELAISFARSKKNDEFIFYPIVESIQKNGICIRVEFPAELTEKQKNIIEESCQLLANKIDYHGIMSVEFFECMNGEILYNECSPRPHNSAHYTMDAFNYSQFDLHLAAILGLDFPRLELLAEKVMMINLLGNLEEGESSTIPELLKGEFIHLYNKKQSRLGRKMGHLNVLGNDKNQMTERLNFIQKEVKL